MIVTRREYELERDLVERVLDGYTLEQIAFGYYETPTTAKRRVGRLVRLGDVRREQVVAVKPMRILGPMCVWYPGERVSDFGRVANAGASRWKKWPCRGVSAFTASRRTRERFGGSRSGHSTSHNLRLSGVFLCRRELGPEQAARWRNESYVRDLVGKDGVVCDAMVVDETEAPCVAIEVIGQYDASRLQQLWAQFVGDCGLGIPLELY